MEKQKNIPALHFPEFKSEWKEKKYEDIFSFRVTNSFSRENLNYDTGSVKNIHYGDIHTKFHTLFDITKELVPFINPEIDIKRIAEENYCKEGDLLIADASEDYNDVGKCVEIVNLNGERVLAGLHTILARPDLYKMAIGFNGYLMQTENIRLQIKTLAHGSKVLSISTKALGGIDLVIPDIPEQQKIASFLTSIDERLQALKKKKSLLERFKKGIMQKIFSQELRFKDEKGKEFSKWEEKRLGEIAKLQAGFAFKSELFKKEGTPVIRISNISNNNNYIDFENIVYYDEIPNAENFTIRSGDLIIAMSGATTGKASIYNLDFNSYLNQRVGLFKSRTNQLNYSYLVQFVFSEEFKKQLDAILVAGAQPNVSSTDIETLAIQFPCLAEQNKIANFLSAIDEKITYCMTEIEKTEQYKKGLLQQMFC